MPTETVEINLKETSEEVKAEVDRPALADLGEFLKSTEALVPVAVLGVFLIIKQ